MHYSSDCTVTTSDNADFVHNHDM